MGIPTIDYAFKALPLQPLATKQGSQDMAKGKHKVLYRNRRTDMATPVVAPISRNSQDEESCTGLDVNDVVILDNVADAKVISQTAQQLQLLEQRGYSDEALCRLMGVPRSSPSLGDGGGNYRNAGTRHAGVPARHSARNP